MSYEYEIPQPNHPDYNWEYEMEDKSMDNLALQIIDEEVREGFIINNDNLAEWAICKIAEERAESQRYINVCETMINDYRLKIQKEQEKLENKTGYLRAKLQEYFATVQHKATKTQETYKLPSGTLKLKYGTPEFVRDEESFIKWLKSNGYEDKVKVKETADWAEFKKSIKVDTDKVLTAFGEIVEGVSVQWNPEKFEIEV